MFCDICINIWPYIFTPVNAKNPLATCISSDFQVLFGCWGFGIRVHVCWGNKCQVSDTGSGELSVHVMQSHTCVCVSQK